jgi:hypothetical protein
MGAAAHAAKPSRADVRRPAKGTHRREASMGAGEGHEGNAFMQAK